LKDARLEVGSRQPVWAWLAIELPDIKYLRFIYEDRRLVVIHVRMICSGIECHHRWDTLRASFPVHAVPAYTFSHWHDLHIGE